MREATITINGTALNDAQASVVRLAVETLASDLRVNGLGDDAMGKELAQLYLARIVEIRKLLFSLRN